MENPIKQVFPQGTILKRGEFIEQRTLIALEQAYLSLQEIIANLYAEAENAVSESFDSNVSLLFAQADKLYAIAENLESIISEQRE